MIVTLSSLSVSSRAMRQHTHARRHAITNAHAHTMTYKHTELINFLTNSQKFISKAERICSCKCDEKPLNARISEANGKYFSITHHFVNLMWVQRFPYFTLPGYLLPLLTLLGKVNSKSYLLILILIYHNIQELLYLKWVVVGFFLMNTYYHLPSFI